MLARLSIRQRITLWYVLLLAVILAVFIASVYLVLRQTLYRNLDESIQNQAGVLLDEAIQFEGGLPSIEDLVRADDDWEEAEQFVRVFDASGNLTFDNSAAMGDPDELAETGAGLSRVPSQPEAIARALEGRPGVQRFVINDDDRVRARTFPIERNGQIVGALQVGQSEDDVSDILSTLLFIMSVAYFVTLAVAVFGGVFIAGRALSPVDKITGLARRVSEEHLDQRLNLRLPDDEVGRLARTFDEMIGRLEDAFRRQRRFTADASHELRTPLTIMKGQLDVALQKRRGQEEYRRVLQAVNDEVDRLIRLASSLLTLTRADAGEVPLTLEKIEVAGVVTGATEQLRSTALRKGIELRLDPGDSVAISADEDLLLQLLLNLLDNAIKYTPDRGRVEVGWSDAGGRVELWVRDNGVGIAEEHLPHNFDRFYRVDKARSRSEGGAGLGLAISRWIAEAHHGSIRAESVPGKGSTLTVVLPTTS